MSRELALVSTDRLFYTVQGEGPLTGVPSVFLRLDTCNLKCKWGDTLCDAHYTSWTPSGQKMLIENLVAEVAEVMARHRAQFLVITGGEPALQPEVIRALTKFGRNVSEVPWHTTLETNGTVFVEDHGLDLICLSPKLQSSVPVGTKYEAVHERNRWKPEAVKAWMASAAYYFKFVVDTKEDLAEVEAMLREVNQPWSPTRVLLMPQGVDSETLWQRGRWLVEECKRLGARFAPRIQVDLWGNTPGT